MGSPTRQTMLKPWFYSCATMGIILNIICKMRKMGISALLCYCKD